MIFVVPTAIDCKHERDWNLVILVCYARSQSLFFPRREMYGGGKSRTWYTLSAHVPKCTGILGYRYTPYPDIFGYYFFVIMGVASAVIE